MIKSRIKRIIKSNGLFLKVIVTIRDYIKKKKIQNDFTYSDWIKFKEDLLWEEYKGKLGEKISVVVPTYNTPDKYLIPLVDSLLNQTYSNWELCISDASTDLKRSKAIKKVADQDNRIKYTFHEGLHISDNTNNGLKLASGKYIGLLDHDDILSVHALEEVMVAISKNKNADIIYSDEDKISDDGKDRLLPFFKPNWSPDLLLGVNYITHFLVVSRSLVDKVDGLRSKYDGAQDYDLLLRLTELTDKIIHIPKILYHWRLADGSTSKSIDEKSYADNAGQEALRDAVKRRNIKADVVEIPERPTNYRLRYTLPEKQPKVSIIIPFKDKPELLRKCIDSILSKTTYKNYEIILLSNNSIDIDTQRLVRRLSKNKKIKSFEWNNPFNYSKINNFGFLKASGDYIVLLNNDTEVITPYWLDELVGVALQPGVGVVGPMLLYPNAKDGIQHAGIVLGMNTMAGHVFRHRQPGDWTDFGLPIWPRNYLALTAACFLVSRKIYNEVGGLDEIFTIAGNDVAFCLSVYKRGYRNIYWPFVQLYHNESVSIETYDNGIQLDYDHSLEYYKPYHESGDPYFNPNLDLMNEQIGVAR